MGDNSAIEWTDATWNPVRGCAIVSKGCTNCYAMRQAHRTSGTGGAYAGLTKLTKGGPVWTGEIRLVHELLDQPLRWRRPRRIFVNSMSDLFHEDVPLLFIGSVLGIAAACPQHTFQVLTKRAARMREAVQSKVFRDAYEASVEMYADEVPWPPPNVWLGVSVEDQAAADERIPQLLDTPAAVRWISAEPLLGPLDLAHYLPLPREYGITERTFGQLDWVVAGGESGPGARPMHPDWARSLRDQCAAAGVPFFFKQWGAWAPLEEHRGLGWKFGDPRTGYFSEDRPGAYEWHHKGVASHGAHMLAVGKKAAGRQLDGRTHDEYPA